jgi:hypothetical protein
VVVEDLRAGTARAGIAHGPEVVARGDAKDLAIRQASDAPPEVESVVVLGEDSDQQSVLGQTVFPGYQVPGQLDRALLEIIAEGKIPQHLEEGVMARGIAYVFQIVMLAAGAHAFLRGYRAAVCALFRAGEDVLELHHARVGEHEGRIVAGYQRARLDNDVIVGHKIVEKRPANVVGGVHHPYSQPASGEVEAHGPDGPRKLSMWAKIGAPASLCGQMSG